MAAIERACSTTDRPGLPGHTLDEVLDQMEGFDPAVIKKFAEMT